ncbi:hypothetical protein [Bacillus massilinigeriensis]|uniref:hypothetical protein n=1 Tax=Bacillus mediterraneensis TaxID=1805474 RepID=UPI0008F9220F|nr:hypothetical protein [Bacillus mediterraneensis]
MKMTMTLNMLSIADQPHVLADKGFPTMIPCIWHNGNLHWVLENNFYIREAGVSIQYEKVEMLPDVNFYEIIISGESNMGMSGKLIIMHRHKLLGNKGFAFLSPAENVIFHLDNQFVYLVDSDDSTGRIRQSTVLPWSIVKKGNIWGTKQQESLLYQPLGQGDVASLQVFDFNFKEEHPVIFHTWCTRGKDKDSLLKINRSF